MNDDKQDGEWVCEFCGEPRDEAGPGSFCCGEVNHTVWRNYGDEE